MAKNKQQTLTNIIALKGHVDNTVGKVGQAIELIGSQIDDLSQKFIDLGTDSTQSFASYDDIMREVQALGEYDAKTMKVLDEYNKTIAQTSKYTMEQAGQAEVLIAQLGLDFKDTTTLLPEVMSLAKAGKLELADSLDYLYYSLNALDKPLDYAGTLTDQMAKAAAISAADIDTLGLSLQRLGSGAQFFTGGSSEILAILGGISQFGQDMQGREAGTQLRNFMLTLLAPTGSKQTLMESLGVTEEEWGEFEAYMEDAGINVTDTADAMNKLGLSVYDSNGNLKPAIQIIGELDAALGSLGEKDRNAMLGNLFGKRTSTTAKNLISSLETIIGFQHQIENDSDGYAEIMGDTMEGGIGGTLRQYQSSLDALKVTMGEVLEPHVTGGAEKLTDMFNAIANTDKDTLNLVVSGFAGIAAAGPTMMLAGGAVRLIGSLATPVGAVATGLTVAAMAAGAIAAYADMDFESNFGGMDLNDDALLNHVNALGDAFEATYANVNAYNGALETALSNYETASTTLSGDLLTNMITGAALTEEQKTTLSGLGETMAQELTAGINAGFDKSASYVAMLFGSGWSDDPDALNAILTANSVHASMIAQAEQLGKDFGETLGAAMDDGIITGDEYRVIMEKMQAYDKAMAIQADAERAGEREQMFHKAKSVSWDSAESFLAEQAAILNENMEEAALTHAYEVGKWTHYYDEAIAQGIATVDDKDRFLTALQERYEALIASYEADNADIATAVFDALMSGSDFGEAWNAMRRMYDSGTITRNADGMIEYSSGEWLQYRDIYEQLLYMMNAEGGWLSNGGKIMGLLEPYMAGADAQEYAQIFADLSTIISHIEKDMAAYNTLAAEIEAKEYEIEQLQISLDIEQAIADRDALQAELDKLAANINVTGLYDDAVKERNDAQTYLTNNPGSWKVNVSTSGSVSTSGLDGYAEGGRADIPSIFGEAGPEWAIPEEHSQRTADLLNAARAASGFTWPELIARNGGLNAGGGFSGTIIYQPTIIANDSQGVEQKLIEDKARFEKWWNDKQMREDMEVYA